MSKLSFILICGLIPSLHAKCTVKELRPQLSRSVYEFSNSLLTKVAQATDIHFVTSTQSIWTLLALTSLGATDTTAEELKQVLRLENYKCFNKYLKIANSITSDNMTDVILERTSNIYVDNKLKILKKFKNKILKAGIHKFENISFEDKDSAAQVINNYVSQATHNSIDKIVSPGDFENVVMLMIDAVYFKGSWQIPFAYQNTQVSPFLSERGFQIGRVNLMFSSRTFKMRFIEKINAKVLELPYGKGDRYSMLLFLPSYDKGVYSVIENLKLVNISSILSMLEEYDYNQEVIVQIPRFKITSDLNTLKEVLIGMGLKTMFDSYQAHFQLISHSPLYVSNVIQKAEIEVTEEGTVGSAATRAEFGFRSSPGEFIANRPFLFMIVDKKVEVPIFTGVYSKPSLF